MQPPIQIYVEATATRTFAGAIEWPGWCRGARTEDLAIEIAPGLRVAIWGGRSRRAGMAFASTGVASSFDVAGRLAGGAGTEFGVPVARPRCGRTASSTRQSSPGLEAPLLRAAWETFADAADRAVGISLRLGPQGGGRDLAKIQDHVRMSEEAYLTQLGARPPRTLGAVTGTGTGGSGRT